MTGQTDLQVLKQRALASQCHLLVMTLTVGLLITWMRWRRSEGLVQHHAQQATLLNLGLHLLGLIHVALHLLAWGARAVSEWIQAGLPSQDTGWAIDAFARIIFINWFTLALAGLIGLALAAREAVRARRGEWSSYPLLGDFALSSSSNARARDR